MHRRLGLFVCLSLAAAFVVVTPAYAKGKKDKPKPHEDKVVDEALKRFEGEFKSKDIDRRMRILRWLGMHRHKLVLKRLKTIVIKEKDGEVQAVAAEGFQHQISEAKSAIKIVQAALEKFRKYGSRIDPDTLELQARNNEEAQVLVNLIHSLAALRPYGPKPHKNDGFKDLQKLIDHDNDDVAVAMFEYVEKVKEYRALPKILEWFHFYPDGTSWAGASASVDTGTAGNKDQKAAKSKAVSKANSRRKKVRPAAWAAMSKTVQALTGKEMKKPAELKDWMDENKLMLKKHGL